MGDKEITGGFAMIHFSWVVGMKGSKFKDGKKKGDSE